MAGSFAPAPKDAMIRENCEVLFVAIVIALGVRTYFLQPFTIPTGSMQPTLNGIIGYPTKAGPPNVLKRVAELLVRGRTYVEVVCKAGGTISGLTEHHILFYTYTTFDCGGMHYKVSAPIAALEHTFDVAQNREYRAGDVIARGYINTGDHVFVDKFTYNFRAPHRGEVFVFSTLDIARIENYSEQQGVNTSQFYIKRLVGLPSDELRVDSPKLYVNGKIADSFGCQRVMSAIGAYHGYINIGYLGSPESVFDVPARGYFAMGDNSQNSLDSRYWGTVPQRNIMGRGLFVYWPFATHWGLIK
jgi:signal peptidase I